MELSNYQVGDTLNSNELCDVLRNIRVESRLCLTGETPNQKVCIKWKEGDIKGVISNVEDIPNEEGLWMPAEFLNKESCFSIDKKYTCNDIKIYSSRYAAEKASNSKLVPYKCVVMD